MAAATRTKRDNPSKGSVSVGADLRATSAVATAIVVASIPIYHPQVARWARRRTMRMRNAASTRAFCKANLVVARGVVRGRRQGQKASAERPAEMLLDGSPIEQWANRLRALWSALSRGNNEETRQRAGQIAQLKAG